ncbi:GFA family protein [Albimonas sp. CAU 1670]|uniref:GFA family protein n=1 Tax=Albimonas sp. CAU 1670 TaxID=3032599 RepID=UPI0023DBFE4F|nr:GFA family protein [Albimonas sp. CAU 1670]MDF2234205.1 GFA family protein [Albimonas sp. CAU 1670]
MTYAGRCQCGACRFEFEGPANWVGHCHCLSCRRASSSPLTTYVAAENGRWRWTGAAPKVWSSSAQAHWHRCPTCGDLMAYASDKPKLAHEIHFLLALVEDPAGLSPTVHWHWDERVDWFPVDDALKKVSG